MKRSLVTAILGTFLLTACSNGGTTSLKDSHVHGLTVDREDSSRVYLATHNGLYVLSNDTDFKRVGRSFDDFMGFSPHSTDTNVLFSSGHPKNGGNLGVLKSKDKGVTWEKISNGNPSGPVDFHAMLVHPANPNHIYGWYKLRVHRSLDGGETWTVLQKQPPEVLSFAGDPRNENVVYIGTISDLLMSTDKGESFASMTEKIGNDVVFDIEVDPNTDSLFLATRDQGILRISKGIEGGTIVETVGKLPGGDFPQYLALDPKDSQTMYAFGNAHVLYKSGDKGKTWQKIL